MVNYILVTYLQIFVSYSGYTVKNQKRLYGFIASMLLYPDTIFSKLCVR